MEMPRRLIVRFVEAVGIGLATASLLAVIDVELVHTRIAVIAALVDLLLTTPVDVVLFEVERWLQIRTTTGVVYGEAILAGTITYGAIAFVMLWLRDRRH